MCVHVFHKEVAVSYCCVCMFAIKVWQCHTAVCACLSERYHRQYHTAVCACLPEKDGSIILFCVDVCHKDMAVSYCCVCGCLP